MKDKHLLYIALGLLLLVNLTWLWEQIPFPLAVGIVIVELFSFLVFLLLWLAQVYMTIREKALPKMRLLSLLTGLAVLVLCLRYPLGFTYPRRIDSNAWMLAGHEGAANCTLTLALLPGKAFQQEEICFDIRRVSGNYRISGDTVYLEYSGGREGSRFEYGVFHFDSLGGRDKPQYLRLFPIPPDTLPVDMGISRYRKP